MALRGLRWTTLMFLVAWCGCTVRGQRLAELKCLEYQKTVVSKQILIPFLFNPQPIVYEVFNCTNVVQLIFGGDQAKFGEFPHHALLGYQKDAETKWGYDFLCGGTLISDQHVLTAAHCLNDEKPVIVRLGEYDIEKDSDQEYDVGVDSVRKHEKYLATRSYHDIALVKLSRPIILSKHIRPACLWMTEERNTTRYTATGFGTVDFIGNFSPVMRKVQLEELPIDDCARLYKNSRRFLQGIHDGQLCVGSFVDGRNTCSGDGGGPLQVMTDSKACTYAVVGITSFGFECGIGKSMAIYTKVSYYIEWIEDNVWGSNAM